MSKTKRRQQGVRHLKPVAPARLPQSAPIIQLVTPGTDAAVDDAVQKLHDSDALTYHMRHGVPQGQRCFRCPADQAMHDMVERYLAGDTEGLAQWQRDLLTNVMAAAAEAEDDTAELVIDEVAEMSPALVEYLADRQLVADKPEPEDDGVVVGSYGEMTAKQLRPLASAAGMPGARVAKKDDMIAWLES